MPARVVLLVTSPRLPAGLLTAEAWDLVRTHRVFAGAETGQTEALRAAGADVSIVTDGAAALLDAIQHEGAASTEDAPAVAATTVIWLSGPTGDERLAREIGLRLAREPSLAELELMYGSWDPAGARLLDAVTVMDRLASPGGDPWKRQQTHASLAKYMLEEAYEAYDAINAEDFGALREELGDVLLQVVLHARMAEERPDGEAWSIDDVAGDLVAKMIRRNPHVFADGAAETIDEITDQWERIKKTEKAGASPMDSIALSQPALSLALKVLTRAEKAGRPFPAADGAPSLGDRLWAIVARAAADGEDPEAELRRVALAKMETFRDTDIE